ncbi:hypothetical protein B0H16DRAFT_1686400 [Mycena metata]|uniref:Polyketide synthase n=1 Tax=Mycena metata TaxID=1033252 RepID=A0AAD7JMR0_9AGAR|nr:hypothetical protein B0H16DRAFT_1686400 [Mycena metata]
MAQPPETILDLLREHVANPATRERHAVECADEYWTYEDLDVISSGLALALEERYGSRPTIAIIAENLPYTFALHLAVWKLRGIVAPIDWHTPPTLLQPMLAKVSPACVVIPSTEKATQEIVLESGFSVFSFTPEETTMTALCQRFLDPTGLPLDHYPAADPTKICIYLFTSSASDVSNIKCVPLTNQTLMAQSLSMLDWHRNTYSEVSFQYLRVLGWGPFSHMLAVVDITAHVLRTGGCYIFGLTPSGYCRPTINATGVSSRDAIVMLLEAIMKYTPESLAAVPWVFEKLKEAVTSEPDFTRRKAFVAALQKFKLLWLGGAQTSTECIKWARAHHIPLVLSIGMTEVGGGIFHRVAEENDDGWLIADRLISDAEFTLVDGDGKPQDSVGELHISSKLIARGYLDHNTSAFVIASDGVITFKTGDRYAKSGGRLKWLGRNDDFILLLSGEMVDPRVLEKTLDKCPSISRACVVGNNFLSRSSQFLCALIELEPGAYHRASTNLDISRVIRSINRELAPPLRITWSRVLILEQGQQIPINRKGQIWRKHLESLFGRRVTALARPTEIVDPVSTPSFNHLPSPSVVRQTVVRIVAHALGHPPGILEGNADSTFAEFGMDSATALVIVRRLNEEFKLNLPRNTCHTFVDINSLSTFTSEHLRHVVNGTVPPRPLSPQSSGTGFEDIVVVGQAVRLPGDLNTPESFWEALVDMRESLLIPVPLDRWDHASFLQKPGARSAPGDINFDRAGFVEVASFDNAFFGISSAEAFSVAPSARLVLETTFQALENANIPISCLKGTDTGVFLAGSMDSAGYTQLMFSAMGFGAYTRFNGTGVANSASCGRLSYLLDIHGPSLSFDTACSGGMVAFDQAVQYLHSGKAETAIVCGANTHSWPGDFGFLSAQKMTSPNSRCATFSSEADGYVPAEGAVSLILKTRRAAERDGDTILAVIRATETKHNGKSQGLVAPNAQGQAVLQYSLLKAASLSASDIDFVETHGTGTSLGDLIEIEGINTVFRGSHTPERPLILGAAKASIGHTEIVAGLVGIVKAIKQLSTGKVPGLISLSREQLNPEIDTTLVPLSISSVLAVLPERSEPYRALVVAYGFAGTLAGTILEASSIVKHDDVASSVGESLWMPFIVSAKSRDALHSYLRLYLDFCANASADDFRSICYTSCVGREHYRYRFSCVVKDLDTLVQRLKARLSEIPSTAPSPNPRLILAFPGQGSQFYGMAQTLAARFPEFKTILTDAAARASAVADFDTLSLLLGNGAAAEEIDRSSVSQICIFVYQYSVCQFLHAMGITPDAVIGNSLGEISAAVEAGALSFELGLQFAVARAKILAPVPGSPAGMAAIAATASTIAELIADLHLADRLTISVFNNESNHVVSGDSEAVATLVSHVKTIGTRATFLNVDQGFHSHCIDPALPKLEAWITEHMPTLRPLELPLFSTVLGTTLTLQQTLEPHYWVEHARNPVLFQQAVTRIKEDKAFKTAAILDIGPTPTAWAVLQSNNLSESTLLSSSAKKEKDQELAFLSAIASLVEFGINVDFTRLLGSGTPKTNLPTYPFQRQRHYPNFIPSRSTGSFVHVSACKTPSLVVDESLFEVLNDHRINGDIVLPASGMVDFFARSKPKHPLDIRFHKPWVLQPAGQSGKVTLEAERIFSLHDGDTGHKLCSGTFSLDAAKRPSIIPTPGPANETLSRDEVYSVFVNVQFGPLFQSIVSLQRFDEHIDGLIEVKPSGNALNDRIRALDACNHMFGACMGDTLDDPAFASGACLPLALDGFSLHVDELPPSFICRYRLPLLHERNNRVISTAFEVLSHSGELLVSCMKYSVTWVDMHIPLPLAPPPTVTLQQIWAPKELRTARALNSTKIVYFGKRCDWTNSLLSADGDLLFDLELDGVDSNVNGGSPVWRPETTFSQLLSTIDLSNCALIVDATALDAAPSSPAFSAYWQKILRVMQTLVRSRTRTFKFIVLSTSGGAAPSALGPLIQGMLRVFRREVGLDGAYGIELPSEASPSVFADIVGAELRGRTTENMISYRYSPAPGEAEAEARLSRLVPELRPVVDAPAEVHLSGVAVVVGMGSIGFPLGSHLLAAGVSTVVFIGRRAPTDETIARQLGSSAQFAYLQTDASDLAALRRALQDITAMYGPIKSIIHTAATVSDAAIESVSLDAFDLVLRPKVHAAYNLHLLAEELALPLDSFVLFSSISVPLGNAGQVAYVAANAYLDALASHRRLHGLPGVSLQLGPWESALVDGRTRATYAATTAHKDGLPLIVRALASAEPVLVIAALDAPALARVAVYATDSLFAPLVAGVDAKAKAKRGELNGADVAGAVVRIVRGVLELGDVESLELNESLSACGVDSIAFGQIRNAVAKALGVDVPLVYLSDAFSKGVAGRMAEAANETGEDGRMSTETNTKEERTAVPGCGSVPN